MKGLDNSLHDDFSVLDNVTVPDLEGDFVLQWRWDTESLGGYQQVWTNCADITIVAAGQDLVQV